MKHRRRLSSRSVNGGVRSCDHDHLYATTCEDLVAENMQLREMIVSHVGIIDKLQDELDNKTTAYPLLDDHKLTARVVRDRRMCLVRCPLEPPVLATRYFGRKSKTIPNRALKRRYMGPPKSLPSAVKEDAPEGAPKTRAVFKKVATSRESALPKSRGKKEIPLHSRAKNMCTDKKEALSSGKGLNKQKGALFPPPPEGPSLPEEESPHIEVPSFTLKPVTSFYQMEGTENINDNVFERRHQKYELDERRRKRWDLQRLREQRARTERQRRKKEKREEPASLYPDPLAVETIEVTTKLPVSLFGHPLPVLEDCDFSLPWLGKKKGRRGRPPSKVT